MSSQPNGYREDPPKKPKAKDKVSTGYTKSTSELALKQDEAVTQQPGGPVMQSEFIWLDGELVPFAEATVHFLSPTLHYGAGVFEGVRCFDGRRGPAIFRLWDHLERFVASIHILGFDRLGFEMEDLRKAVHRTVHANNFTDCYIRLMMYLQGSLGLDLGATEPKIGVAAWKWTNLPGTKTNDAGVRLMVSSFAQMHPNTNMTKARISGQFVNAMLAKTFALRAGFDEAVVLDADGSVAAATSEDIFLVRGGVLHVSPQTAILEGITRDTILALAEDAGYEIKEEKLSRDQLYIADEVFVCGTANGVVPVSEVDYRRIGDGRVGGITRTLQRLYLETVRGESPRSRAWLDFVMSEPLY